jgi:MFS transporter, Spinster family, sphingosine-1-phosphate transporter
VTTTRRQAGTILGCLATANLLAYAARNSLFAVYPALRDRYGFHDAKLGLLATVFIIPHAFATLPFGWAGDRFDRRRVIALGLLLASIAGAAGALATDVATLAISRAVVGLGTAAVVPVANSILGQIYDGPRKASRMAIFNLGLLLGGATGFFVGKWAGFPAVVVVLAIPGALIALVIMLLPVPDHPGTPDASSSLGDNLGGFFASARTLLRIPTLRWMMLSTTAMAFAAGGYNAWLIDFLERDKGMSPDAATNLLAAALVGALVGVVTGGRLADALRARVKTGRLWIIVIGMTLAIPCVIASLVLPPTPLLYVAGIANLFFMFWYHAPIAVSVDDVAPPAYAVAAQGLVIFTMHLFGTAPASYVLGLISDNSSLYVAMWVPLAFVVVAIVAMMMATRTFVRDVRAARGGGAFAASL